MSHLPNRHLFALFIPLLIIVFVTGCVTDDLPQEDPEQADESSTKDDGDSKSDDLDETGQSPTPRLDFQRDGSVHIGHERFDTIEEFQNSELFWEGGHRCASEHGIAPGTQLVDGEPGDCSFNFTSIDPKYNADTVYTIPVVFHVIKQTDGTGHISEDLIHSQLEVLNEDFRALASSPGAAGPDARIEFVAAEQDPSGNPTSGINYHTNDQWFSDPGPGQWNAMKDELNWDPDKYLNIYTNDASGALGYATFPQQSAGDSDDGVVLLWNSVGRNAPDGGVYNQGRTATHEVGHYFGLFHTFQDGCGSSSSPYSTGDRIADTVAHGNPDQQCQTQPSSCGSGDTPIHNYMNYSPDSCMHEFSTEQINRMRCSMVNFHTDLIRVDDETEPEAPEADFSTSDDDLDVQFYDESSATDADLVDWSWDFGDGNTSSTASPNHTYADAGTYTVSLEVTDENGLSDIFAANVSVEAPASSGGTLTNDQAETGLAGGGGDEIHFYIDVPADSAYLDIELFDGSGDADLYVRYGETPTSSDWDCRPYEAGNDESCSFEDPAQGRWYVMIEGYSTFSDTNLVANYAAAPENSPPPPDEESPDEEEGESDEPTVLTADDLSASTDQELQFTVDLPDGLDDVTFETTGGTGDADLYIRKAGAPTQSEYDYRPYLVGNEESVEIDNPDGGTWYVMLYAYEAFSDVTVNVTFEE